VCVFLCACVRVRVVCSALCLVCLCLCLLGVCWAVCKGVMCEDCLPVKMFKPPPSSTPIKLCSDLHNC